MSWLGDYLIGLIGACMVAAIARRILAACKQFSGLGNIVIGLFLIYSIISPLYAIEWNHEWGISAIVDFSQVSQEAQQYQKDAMQQSIKTQSQTYVLNKAKELNLAVEVDITLSETYPYSPCAVRISGRASPYGKQRLSQYIAQEIGIAKEAQTWTTTS